ncbi:hypothetical protein JOF47_000921 [Paeniglutamicibacter kerguelensis]|uniref:Uncharacterized protein n=1 Tax=Paeniglutamicibacter kerguelensis TaxID=254788 RepID=A0ABS4XAC9_9MICC|nr:hypothetical protein [Paeniglutamicibacter kerguelensis]
MASRSRLLFEKRFCTMLSTRKAVLALMAAVLKPVPGNE